MKSKILFVVLIFVLISVSSAYAIRNENIIPTIDRSSESTPYNFDHLTKKYEIFKSTINNKNTAMSFVNALEKLNYTGNLELQITYIKPIKPTQLIKISSILSVDQEPLGSCPLDDTIISSDVIFDPEYCNVLDENNDGILIINADNITIDCNGMILEGNESGFAIVNMGYDNVIIKNCNIKSYYVAIFSELSDDVIIKNNSLNQNRFPIIINTSTSLNIENNKIYGKGIYLGGSGILLDYVNNSVVTNNYIDSIINYGIQLKGNHSLIANNTISNTTHSIIGNPDVGIDILGDDNIVLNNLVADNNWIGILVDVYDTIIPYPEVSDRNLIENNTFCSNMDAVFVNAYLNDSLPKPTNNSIIYNNFLYNDPFPIYSSQADDYGINTSWDDGNSGNHWSDYKGIDSDNDGIGDSPYIIEENGIDNYPLMQPNLNTPNCNYKPRVSACSKIVRITENLSGVWQGQPDIYENNIVYTSNKEGKEHIYLYDLDTNTEKRITNRSDNHERPRIWRDIVVYMSWDDIGFGWNIFMYNLSLNKETRVSHDYKSWYPDIFEEIIVWENYDGNFSYYNITSNKTTKIIITPNRSADEPEIHDYKIVWREGTILSLNNSIVLHDIIKNKTEIVQDTVIDFLWYSRPEIYNNLVVFDSSLYGDGDIFLKNLTTGELKQINMETSDQRWAHIFGDIIVWKDARDGTNDVYMYNISSGETKPIAIGPTYQEEPRVYNNIIVWEDDNSNRNVYACFLTQDCVDLTGLTEYHITESVTLCPGTYLMNDTDSDGALIFDVDDVTLDCDGAVIIGDGTGMGVYNDRSNAIIENCAVNNFQYSIYMISPYPLSNENNIVRNSNLSNSFGGIWVGGHNQNNLIENNLIYDNTKGGIIMTNTQENVIVMNSIYSNGVGVYFDGSVKLGYVKSNNITSNQDGIFIHGTSGSTRDNIIAKNNISNNNNFGIRFTPASSIHGGEPPANNEIFDNYFDNAKNAYDDGINYWNIEKNPGTNIIGGPYLGGNYWSDYTGIDTDGDGLGDTEIPYTNGGNIQNGGDYLPLVKT